MSATKVALTCDQDLDARHGIFPVITRAGVPRARHAGPDPQHGSWLTRSAPGTPVGLNDTAIAGDALVVGAMRVTMEGGAFERVPVLMTEVWMR